MKLSLSSYDEISQRSDRGKEAIDCVSLTHQSVVPLVEGTFFCLRSIL